MEGLAINGGKPIRDDFLVFSAPKIYDAEINELIQTLKSGWIGTGPKVKKFEEEFAQYKGVNHALALNSCTAGLSLGLSILNIGPGDEVITTPMTFAATANVIVHQGAKPVFVDIEEDTHNIDPEKIKAAITEKTKAIMPVHVAGHSCQMDHIMEIANKHSLFVIEDCAHAVETEFKGKKAGAIGDLGVFSFYPNKNMTTGEGGMLITNNEELIDKARIQSLHGMDKDAWKRFSASGFKPYDIVYPGYKYNMTDIQASLGLHQLKRVENNLLIRDKIYKQFNQAFSNIEEIEIPQEKGEIRHARHLYRILIKPEKLNCNRNEFIHILQKENIGSGIHYPALHTSIYYKKQFNYQEGMFPITEKVGENTISLPLSPYMNEKDVNDTIIAIEKVIRNLRK